MKRIFCLVLILSLLIAPAAFASSKGITADEFMEWLTSCQLKIDFALSEYDSRTVFAGFGADHTTVLGYTFKNSPILEASMTAGPDEMVMVYFLSAISDDTEPQKRMDATINITNTVMSNILDVFSNDRSKRYSVKGYSVEMLMDDDALTYWYWISNESKLKTKGSVLSEIPLAEIPISQASLLYYSKKGSAEAQPETATITLSVGTYEAPSHIPVGEYKVTPQKLGVLHIYRNEKLVTIEILDPADNDEIGRLVIQSGDTLEVKSGGKFDFEPLN